MLERISRRLSMPPIGRVGTGTVSSIGFRISPYESSVRFGLYRARINRLAATRRPAASDAPSFRKDAREQYTRGRGHHGLPNFFFLTLFATGFLVSAVLFRRLCKQARINHALRDLAETAPITYKAIDVFGKEFMPNFMGVPFGAMFPGDSSLKGIPLISP